MRESILLGREESDSGVAPSYQREEGGEGVFLRMDRGLGGKFTYALSCCWRASTSWKGEGGLFSLFVHHEEGGGGGPDAISRGREVRGSFHGWWFLAEQRRESDQHRKDVKPDQKRFSFRRDREEKDWKEAAVGMILRTGMKSRSGLCKKAFLIERKEDRETTTNLEEEGGR